VGKDKRSASIGTQAAMLAKQRQSADYQKVILPWQGGTSPGMFDVNYFAPVSVSYSSQLA